MKCVPCRDRKGIEVEALRDVGGTPMCQHCLTDDNDPLRAKPWSKRKAGVVKDIPFDTISAKRSPFVRGYCALHSAVLSVRKLEEGKVIRYRLTGNKYKLSKAAHCYAKRHSMTIETRTDEKYLYIRRPEQ